MCPILTGTAGGCCGNCATIVALTVGGCTALTIVVGGVDDGDGRGGDGGEDGEGKGGVGELHDVIII